MNTVEIVVVIVLLIAILIFLKKRKKCSSCSSKETLVSSPKAAQQESQQPEVKLADKPVVSAIPTAVNPQITDAAVVSSPEPQPANTPESPAKPEADIPTSCLPEDSILRRHYLNHLCTMIESLAPPRPTESVLCRHYDAMVVTRIGRCLNDKKSMEQLIHDYEIKNDD